MIDTGTLFMVEEEFGANPTIADKFGVNGEFRPLSLYQVIHAPTGVNSYVLAESKEGACSQFACNTKVPPLGGGDFVAIPLPLMIRGWGSREF